MSIFLDFCSAWRPTLFSPTPTCDQGAEGSHDDACSQQNSAKKDKNLAIDGARDRTWGSKGSSKPGGWFREHYGLFMECLWCFVASSSGGYLLFTYVEGMPAFDALYLSLATSTTVGYGDLLPLTKLGEIMFVVHVYMYSHTYSYMHIHTCKLIRICATRRVYDTAQYACDSLHFHACIT